MSFSDPDIPQSMQTYLEFLQKKYTAITQPTPVQSQCWPSVLSGDDVLTIAQTGSGKTLGYLLPVIPHILTQMKQRTNIKSEKNSLISNSNKGPIVLIIVPTRELAQQVESNCKPLRSKFGIHSLAIYGGIESKGQKDTLGQEHNEIVIATPGRLVDLIQNSAEVVGLLGRVSVLIFDEADRMLQFGFGDQLQKISEQIRPDRQTLMFSATFPKPMQEAASRWLKSPLKIRVKSSSVNQENTAIVSKDVKQVIKVVPEKERTDQLLKFLKMVIDKESLLRNRSLILVFVNQIKSVKPVLSQIEKLLAAQTGRKTRCGAIHGDMKQLERDKIISEFKSGKVTILVATDILGRGIHINGLRFVINFDFPTSLEQYIHRVGRTGRQGNKGHALTYFTNTPQNVPMAKGLVKILEECKQQVAKELVEVAQSFLGESMEAPKLYENEGFQEDEDDDEFDTSDSDFDFTDEDEENEEQKNEEDEENEDEDD
eukprot:gene6136-7644_t